MRSGVVVARMMRSIACGPHAGALERTARGLFGQIGGVSPSAAMWRPRMPVQVTIQSLWW